MRCGWGFYFRGAFEAQAGNSPLQGQSKPPAKLVVLITRHYTNNSITNTSTQQITDTGNSPAPSHAAMIPAMSATSQEMGVWVAWMMAGKVMTASVT